MYRRGIPDPVRLAQRFSGLHAFLGRRQLDEFYLWLTATFYHPTARFLARVDYDELDQGIVDGVGRLGTRVAQFKRWFDDVVMDGVFVNGWGILSQRFGTGFSRLQTGFAQNYLLVIAFSVSVLVIWLVKTL
jgi:NADH:ubiquinone oxidoreductase subunit 5 (subunit L)/multisubunit Na+/H+ antiporter MnhA subunit